MGVAEEMPGCTVERPLSASKLDPYHMKPVSGPISQLRDPAHISSKPGDRVLAFTYRPISDVTTVTIMSVLVQNPVHLSVSKTTEPILRRIPSFL